MQNIENDTDELICEAKIEIWTQRMGVGYQGQEEWDELRDWD